MKHFGPEPPWTEKASYRDRGYLTSYGEWVEVEPLWDGTCVWEYVDAKPLLTFLELLERTTPRMTEKVNWLEDTFMPKLGEILR